MWPSRNHHGGVFPSFLVIVAWITTFITMAVQATTTNSNPKLFGGLAAVVDKMVSGTTDPDEPSSFQFKKKDFQWKGNDKVLVDITPMRDDGSSMGDALNKLEQYLDETDGIIKMACYMSKCSCYVSIYGPLQDLASADSLARFIMPAMAIINTGLVTSEGDAAMRSDIARTSFGLSGEGYTIGVISDSYNCLNQTSPNAADDVATGDLPSDVLVLMDFFGDGCVDEGRAMMQLILDVAPKVKLMFHTGFGGAATFANGIIELADAGCDVIVDDISNFVEPFFQDGIIAQAAEEVVARGIPYFSSAGNFGMGSWEEPNGFQSTTYTSPEDGDLTVHDFDGTGTFLNSFPVSSLRGSFRVILQWDQPFQSASSANVGCESDLDILIGVDGFFTVVPDGQTNNIESGECVELIRVDPSFIADNNGIIGNVPLQLGIVLRDGPAPTYLKVLMDDFVSFEFNIENPSTSFGHPNAANTAGVAAAFHLTPSVVEDFSSRGGTPILFDTTGTRLDTPEIRNQPRFTGPDGTSTTFFGQGNMFFGTSAAAPHVAAVAALMLESMPSLTPQKTYMVLQETAIDMDDPATNGFDEGFDFRTGYGFVDAEMALSVTTPIQRPWWTYIDIPCFSGRTTVEVETKGIIPMHQLQVGDSVRTGPKKDDFSFVYLLAHYDETARGEFVQIYSIPTTTTNGTITDQTATKYQEPLEVTSSHFVMMADGSVKTASQVRVGDLLSSSIPVDHDDDDYANLMMTHAAKDHHGVQVVVTGIDHIQRRGVYAPFTMDGTIVVNGIVSSNYIAILDDSFPGQQWLEHVAVAPFRWWWWWSSSSGGGGGNPSGVDETCLAEEDDDGRPYACTAGVGRSNSGISETLLPLAYIGFYIRDHLGIIMQCALILLLAPLLVTIYILDQVFVTLFIVGPTSIATIIMGMSLLTVWGLYLTLLGTKRHQKENIVTMGTKL